MRDAANGAVKGRLRITTRFVSPDGGRAEEKHAGYCTIERSGDGLALTWRETREGQNDRIELLLTADRAQMDRQGETRGQLCFIPGQETEGAYETPYGSIPLTIRTRLLEWMEDSTGGQIRLAYGLFSKGALLNDAEMELLWRL